MKHELEDRIVAELQARSLLAAPNTHTRTATRRPRLAWFAGAIAAAIAFVAGLGVGAQHARRSEAAPSAAADSAQIPANIRAAAFAYITALSATRASDTAARAAAIGTFRIAADQIVRLAPESDIAVVLRVAMPSSFAMSPAALAAVTPPKRIIWF